VIDVATRKVTSHFVPNTATKRYRFNGGVPDPAGRFFYTVTTEMNKLKDRYEIGKPQVDRDRSDGTEDRKDV